jgi:hypothetical protein
MTPFHVIRNSDSYPDRVEATFRMVEKMPTLGRADIMLSPLNGRWFKTRVSDGKVYIFLPGVCLVYDYQEFQHSMRGAHEDNPQSQ